VQTESANTFVRMFRGYDPAAVDACIEALIAKQQLLLDDVESLRARLKESGDDAAAQREEAAALREEAAALREKVAVLEDTSPSPNAVQHRMSKMLQRAVDEVSEMQAEARAEAEALIAAAEAEAEATHRKHEELLADMATQRTALEAELARLRTDTQSALDEASQHAQQERERLLAEAKHEADDYRERARRAVGEASQQRVEVMERLMGVYRDLEAVPANLESALQERKTLLEASLEANEVVPSDEKVSTG
jgi:cell division septum initiation protein DivIVA